MTTRLLWITDDPFDGLSDDTIAEARKAGATEILHGVPISMVGEIDPATRGFVALHIPDPEIVGDEPLETPGEVPEQTRWDAFAAVLDDTLDTATTLTRMRGVLRDALTAGRAIE